MTEVNLDDFERLMEKKPNLSKFTKKGYLGHYRTLTRGLEKPIRNSSEKQILNVIKELSDKVGTQNALINMAILIFQLDDKNYDKLKKTREDNIVKIDRERIKVNNAKIQYLPNRQQLLYYLEDLFKQEKWEEYIINYLLVYLNVRNQDLDLLFIDKMKDALDSPSGKKEFKKDNFLIIRKNDITYLRSKYKTHNLYGTKTNSIQSTKFRRAVLEFLKEQEGELPTPLLHKTNGSRLADGYIHKYITAKTYEGLSEADYMKIIVNYVDETGNLKNLQTLSNNRGTSVDTLIKNYNLKFELPTTEVKESEPKPEPKKEIETKPEPKPEPKPELTMWEEGLKKILLKRIKVDNEKYLWRKPLTGEPVYDEENKQYKKPKGQAPKVKPRGWSVAIWDKEYGVWLIEKDYDTGDEELEKMTPSLVEKKK